MPRHLATPYMEMAPNIGNSSRLKKKTTTKQGLYALVFKYSLISFSSTEYVTIIFKVHLLH